METSVLDLVELRNLPTGRRRHAVHKVKHELEELRGNALGPLKQELLTQCERALAHDREVAAMQQARLRATAERQLLPNREALAVDAQIDRVLGAIAKKIEAELAIYPPSSPEARELLALELTLFPEGVAGITTRSHVEQYNLVKDLLTRADANMALLVRCGAERLCARLRELHEAFHRVLDQDKGPVPTARDVQAAARKGNRLVRTLITGILYATRDEDDRAMMQLRQHLLAPILRQDAIVREQNKRSRRLTDVDPDTGDDLPLAPDEA